MGNGRFNMNRFFDPRFRRLFFNNGFFDPRFSGGLFNSRFNRLFVDPRLNGLLFFDPRFSGGLFNSRFNRLFVDPRLGGLLFNSRFNLGLFDPLLIPGFVQGLFFPF